MNSVIEDLQKQIEIEKNKMANCNHSFQKPFYNAEVGREMCDYKLVVHGSDVYYEPSGWKDVKKDRWTRVCSICGKEEHTYQQVPVIEKYEPKF